MSSSSDNAIAIGADHPPFLHFSIENLETSPLLGASYAYCSGIEDWGLDELRRVLPKILRNLVAGGVVRIVARDLDAVIYGYLLERNDPDAPSRGRQINLWRETEAAKYLFNEEDLRAELETAGFCDIWRLPAGASSAKIFQNCEPDGSALLALEGRKPASAS